MFAERNALDRGADADAFITLIRQLNDAAAPLLFVGTMAVWLAWQYTADANLAAVGIRGLRYTPSWAMLWWAIPFANLGAPAFVHGGLLRGSKAGPGGDAEHHGAALIALWWFPFMVGVVFVGIGIFTRVFTAEMFLEELVVRSVLVRLDAVALWWIAVGQALLAAAAVAAMVMIRKVASHQARWPAPSAAFTRPDAAAGPPDRPDLVGG